MSFCNKTGSFSAHVLACLGLTLAGNALAADEPSPSAPTAEATSLAGQRVVRDPATGLLREPESDEMQGTSSTPANARSATSAAQQRRAQTMQRFRNLTPVTGAKGATGYRLDASHMSFSVARRQADGSLAQDCVTGEQAATELMSTPVASVTPEVVTEAKEHDHAR